VPINKISAALSACRREILFQTLGKGGFTMSDKSSGITFKRAEAPDFNESPYISFLSPRSIS
jgi:hypothetical protein